MSHQLDKRSLRQRVFAVGVCLVGLRVLDWISTQQDNGSRLIDILGIAHAVIGVTLAYIMGTVIRSSYGERFFRVYWIVCSLVVVIASIMGLLDTPHQEGWQIYYVSLALGLLFVLRHGLKLRHTAREPS